MMCHYGPVIIRERTLSCLFAGGAASLVHVCIVLIITGIIWVQCCSIHAGRTALGRGEHRHHQPEPAESDLLSIAIVGGGGGAGGAVDERRRIGAAQFIVRQ